MLFGPASGCPRWQSITAANVNDITEAVEHLPIQRWAVYVFDKGYCDYNWWSRLNALSSRFVTRFKYNAALVVKRVLSVPPGDSAIVLCDELVRFKYKSQGGGRHNGYEHVLRRVTVARPGKQSLVLATNDLSAPAMEIALRYKQRWLVELFFKWIKQHLKIRHFMGRSQNAVKTQLLTALIAYLLLKLYALAKNYQSSLWTLLGQLRTTLFEPADVGPAPRTKPSKPQQPKPQTMTP